MTVKWPVYARRCPRCSPRTSSQGAYRGEPSHRTHEETGVATSQGGLGVGRGIQSPCRTAPRAAPVHSVPGRHAQLTGMQGSFLGTLGLPTSRWSWGWKTHVQSLLSFCRFWWSWDLGSQAMLIEIHSAFSGASNYWAGQKGRSGFFRTILWENPDKLFGQPHISKNPLPSSAILVPQTPSFGEALSCLIVGAQVYFAESAVALFPSLGLSAVSAHVDIQGS